MLKCIKILVAEDRQDKIQLIQRSLTYLQKVYAPDYEFQVTYIKTLDEFNMLKSPTDFDMAFIDKYLAPSNRSSIVNERALRDDAPMSLTGGIIVFRIQLNNEELYKSTFSISLEGLLNVLPENVLSAYGLTPDVFEEKVLPRLEAIMKDKEINESEDQMLQ